MGAGSGEALRQQLGDEARWQYIRVMHAVCPRSAWSYRECGACASRVNAIWPIIAAALAAARVATATEIAEAIKRRTTPFLSKNSDEVNGYLAGIQRALDVVSREIAAGGSVPAPKGDQ